MTDNNHAETKLLEQISEVLSILPEYWEGRTLLKNKVIEDIRTYKESVIQALLANELIKNTYSLTLDPVTIFKILICQIKRDKVSFPACSMKHSNGVR